MGKAWLVGCGPGSTDHLTVSHVICAGFSEAAGSMSSPSKAHSALSLKLQAATPGAMTSLVLHVQLKAVRLLKASDVILYDDLGAEASPRQIAADCCLLQ